jgi:hypothetical protein
MSTYTLDLSFHPGKYSEADKKGNPLGPRAYIVVKRCSSWKVPFGRNKRQNMTVLGLSPLMCLEEAEAAIDRLIKELQELKKKIRKLFREDKKKWQAWRDHPLGSVGEEGKN